MPFFLVIVIVIVNYPTLVAYSENFLRLKKVRPKRGI